MTEQRRTRWEYDLPYDLRQTAQQVDAAQGTGRPRPGFADDLEARLMRQAQEMGHAPGPRRPAWWTRLAMPALALGLLLPTLVVATALISLLTILVGSNVFTTPPSLPTPPPTSLSDRAILDSQFKPVVMAHLGIKLHLQARACGYTVTLDSAYADTEHAIFGYTVMGPRGRVYPSVIMGLFKPHDDTDRQPGPQLCGRGLWSGRSYRGRRSREYGYFSSARGRCAAPRRATAAYFPLSGSGRVA